MAPAADRHPIRPLERAVVEQIAAGEVVDSPDAVVRELVDNALDAAASRVQVELRRGGLDLVRVADDGLGIPAGDVELAFEHHATSKLRSLDELGRLSSLGFRGEALPAIAAAGEVELVSSTGQSSAVRVLLRDGRLVERGVAARERGTTVFVRGLFAGLPARLRFLRAQRAELAAIARRIRWYAVAQPGVRFELIADGRPLFRSRGAGRRDQALVEGLGEECRGALLESGPRQCGPFSISAWLTGRGLTRPSRQHLAVFVNGRRARVPGLEASIEQAYRGLLPAGRHPLGAIWVEAEPGVVDLNVHPSKEEIRVLDQETLVEGLSELVRELLAGSALEPERLQPVRAGPGRGGSGRLAETEALWELPAEARPPRYLGQLHGALLLCEAPAGLYLIDLHRAHEWVLYERLRSDRQPPPAQGVLDQTIVDVAAGEVARIEARLDELRGLGFDYQRIGEAAFRLCSAPFLPEPAEALLFAREALSMAAEQDAFWRDRLLATVACRSAVKKGRGLPPAAAVALIGELFHRGPPTLCPHGSPLMLQLSRPFLGRQFRW